MGYTKYVEIDNQIIKNKTASLKLGVLMYSLNEQLNTLDVETTKIKFFSCSEKTNIIYNLNDFIGVYLNKYSYSL